MRANVIRKQDTSGQQPRLGSSLSSIMSVVLVLALACLTSQCTPASADQDPAALASASELDHALTRVLEQAGFTGHIASTLEQRIGRRIDKHLANLGRLIWFDTITGLNDDNTCAGCHSPTNGFGDTQSIAIGIDNNGIVGPHRAGPRNMRRAPMVLNTAFFPNLMWNSRFMSLSGNPFDNSAGFLFPPPEGLSLSSLPHLLVAQAFIPPTERSEVAGFVFPGDNFTIRAEVLHRLNSIPGYRKLFGQRFPAVQAGAPITFAMFGAAIAEFEFTLTFANAPADRYARGDTTALTENEKRGALLFFGEARCVTCHAVSGHANEMFSDFQTHGIGVPQLVPLVTNMPFDGPHANEDFGREEVSGDPADRYQFRTAPLRNVALQPRFMHNGAFRRLEDAVRHHLDVFESALTYTTAAQQLDPDLTISPDSLVPVLAHLDPLLATPVMLTEEQFQQLVAFVRHGLLDPRAKPDHLHKLVPKAVPSGRPVLFFEFPSRHSGGRQ